MKVLNFSFFFVLLACLSRVQVGADRLDYGDSSIPDQTGGPGDADGAYNGEAQLSEAEYQELMLQAQRVMIWGCYFLSKNVLYDRIDDINKLLELSTNKDLLFKRVINDLMMECAQKATPRDMQELIGDYNKEGFNIAKWAHLHSFDAEKYKGEAPPEEGENQYIAYEYYKQIDEIVKQQFKEKNEGIEFDDYGRPIYNDPTFMGVSLNDISYYMKILFFSSLVGLIGLTIYNAYAKRALSKQVTEAMKLKEKTGKGAKGEKTEDKKEKKEKKEDKEEKEEKEEKKETEVTEKTDKKGKKKAKTE